MNELINGYVEILEPQLKMIAESCSEFQPPENVIDVATHV